MRNLPTIALLSVLLLGLCPLALRAEATSASITDKSGTKYVLSDLKSDAEPPVSPLLPRSEHSSLLAVEESTHPVRYWIRMSEIVSVEKEAKGTYSITLRSTKTVTGSLSGNLTGKDDLGETKVSLDGDNIRSISINEGSRKAPPSSSSKNTVYPGAISIGGKTITVKALAFSGGYTSRYKSAFKQTWAGGPVWETSRGHRFITKIEFIRGETTTVVDFAKIGRISFSGNKDANNRPQVTLFTRPGKEYQGSIDFEDLYGVSLVGNTDFGTVSIPMSSPGKLKDLNIEIQNSGNLPNKAIDGD